MFLIACKEVLRTCAQLTNKSAGGYVTLYHFYSEQETDLQSLKVFSPLSKEVKVCWLGKECEEQCTNLYLSHLSTFEEESCLRKT